MANERVAVVTGASRGVGRGVAIGLLEAGYKVFATGRTVATADLPEPIVRLPTDHSRDGDTAAAFARVASEGGRLDVLVNSAWGGYERMVERGQFTWPLPFWEQAPERWSSMMDVGVRSAYMSSAHAARIMVPQRRGLIVNISNWSAQKYIGNVVYGVSKAATDKMTADMAHELRRTAWRSCRSTRDSSGRRRLLEAASQGWFDLGNSESPEFSGRVIAALADDPALPGRSGSVVVGAAMAAEFGIADVDGRRPVPLTLETA